LPVFERKRPLAVLVALLLVAAGAASWPILWRKPRAPILRVTTSAVAQAWGRSNCTPVVKPGQYTWAEGRIEAAPLGQWGAVVLDFGAAACVANLDKLADMGHIALPNRRPEAVICITEAGSPLPDLKNVRRVDPNSADAVWWLTSLKVLGLRKGCLTSVRGFGDKWRKGRSLGVPFHSCYVGEADMHSQAFVGCSAVVLYGEGEVIFAHCTGVESPGWDPKWFTVEHVFELLDPLLQRRPGKWRAFLASGEKADGEMLKKELQRRGIPLKQEIFIGKQGHSVYFSRRTQSLVAVPENP